MVKNAILEESMTHAKKVTDYVIKKSGDNPNPRVGYFANLCTSACAMMVDYLNAFENVLKVDENTKKVEKDGKEN